MTKSGFLNAINMFERAIAVDACYALAYAGLGDSYALLYRHGVPLAEARRPGAGSRRRGAGPDRAPRALNPDDHRSLYMGSAMLAALGRREQAIEWAEAAVRARETDSQTPYNVACTYGVPGDADRALELLERACDNGWSHRQWLENDSDLVILRGHPRFQRLLQRMPSPPDMAAGVPEPDAPNT